MPTPSSSRRAIVLQRATMTTTATTTTTSTQVVRRKSLRLLEAAAARAALENGDHDNDKCVPVAAAKEAAPPIRQSLRSSFKRKSCSSSIATNESNDKQADSSSSSLCAPKKSKPRRRRSYQKTKTTNEDDDDSSTKLRKECLARTRERQLLQASVAGQEDTTSSDGSSSSSTRSSSSSSTIVSHVMGIDEAGRGPLCGPVVAAAAVVPTDLAGITDSKKLTKEHVRECLYEQIVTSPNVRWAVAVMDAARIDQINILQATLQGMQWAAQGVMGHRLPVDEKSGKSQRQRLTASCHETGCYVVCGATDSAGKPLELEQQQQQPWTADSVVALVDGNKIPADMPCRAECMVKGDSREYAIAAASILAKVTRDRLMRGYHELYPAYDMKQNKGYPTAAHMAAVRKHGASPIHRRSFAPLKHMEFNEKGEILQDNS